MRDNAAIGKCCEVVGNFAKMICDHKMYDCFVSLYWPEMHGKCDADQLFGLLEQLMATHPLFSIDELMALALKILWRGRKTESHILSAEALTEWAPYFKAQDETPFHSSVRHHAYAYPMACSSGPRGLRSQLSFRVKRTTLPCTP